MTVVWLAAVSLIACNRVDKQAPLDNPRLPPSVSLRDVTFHSTALNRDMPYRVLLPANAEGKKLAVVYLLHGGGGGNFRDWSNYSDVGRFVVQGLILVMPGGDDSYYTNSAEHPHDRYEDYIVRDLVFDVESRFPVATGANHRAIVGVSMGGFGAVKIALRHPDMFAFAGGISSAIDVPSRPFSIKRIGQWHHHSSIFGPWGSATRRENDPFVLTRTADPKETPYLFLTCGRQEGLLPANQAFAKLLEQRKFRFEFHVVPGGHDWNNWNARLEDCFRIMLEQLESKQEPTVSAAREFPHSLPQPSLP